MREFLEAFSNREIAIVFWLGIIILFGLLKAFKEIAGLIIILFSKSLLPFYFIIIVYFTAIIYWLNSIGIWDNTLYKDLLFWFFTTAAVSFFKTNNVNNWKELNALILHVFSWNIIIEFLIDNYNFTLRFEIIFIPVSVVVATLFMYASYHKEREGYSAVAKLLNIILSASGSALLCYVVFQFATKYEQVFTISSLKSFLFSPLFTLLFSPLIIFTVFFMKYENVFQVLNRYKFLKPNRKTKIKMAIIKYANFNFDYIKNAHEIILWRKGELRDSKSISKYLKKAIKVKVDKSIYSDIHSP
jgi:hypothetical protein